MNVPPSSDVCGDDVVLRPYLVEGDGGEGELPIRRRSYAGGMTTPPPGYPVYAPTPPMSPADERLWATLTHVSGILLSWLGPLIGYLVLRERGPFVRAHTAAALNFQLTVLIAYVACIPLLFFIVGYFLLPAVGVFALVVEIIAAVKANQGQWYTPPLTIRFVS
jgi:uncharacterized protein